MFPSLPQPLLYSVRGLLSHCSLCARPCGKGRSTVAEAPWVSVRLGSDKIMPCVILTLAILVIGKYKAFKYDLLAPPTSDIEILLFQKLFKFTSVEHISINFKRYLMAIQNESNSKSPNSRFDVVCLVRPHRSRYQSLSYVRCCPSFTHSLHTRARLIFHLCDTETEQNAVISRRLPHTFFHVSAFHPTNP